MAAGRATPACHLDSPIALMNESECAADCSIYAELYEGKGLYSCDFPKQFLAKIRRVDAISTFDHHEINNLWLPLPKHVVRRLLTEPGSQAEYNQVQKMFIERERGNWPWPEPWHIAMEDGDEALKSVRILGEGGFGIVDQVVCDTAHSGHVVCVRKRFGRPHALNGQKKLFEAFRREINVMRQVFHRHCVKFVGSYTDYDSVSILSAPVADMNLADFLDMAELSPTQLNILRQGIGCLCGALGYLHGKHIRSVSPSDNSRHSIRTKVC